MQTATFPALSVRVLPAVKLTLSPTLRLRAQITVHLMAVIFPTYLRVKSIRFNGKTGSGLRHNYSLKNNLNIIVCFIFYNYQLHQY
ncbi:TPA: hypothetical protein ACIVM6_004668, partial [Salmonella enterica subsp. salamae serovar 21:z10:z6]